RFIRAFIGARHLEVLTRTQMAEHRRRMPHAICQVRSAFYARSTAYGGNQLERRVRSNSTFCWYASALGGVTCTAGAGVAKKSPCTIDACSLPISMKQYPCPRYGAGCGR